MSDIQTKLKELWNGNVPLWQSFWLYYFIALTVLNFIAKTVGGSLGTGLGLLSLLWAGFMVLPIWKAANSYEGNALFALAAKIAAVLIAIGVLGILL